MDKRWIYILIIAVIGITCLFFIAESSTTIGKATVKVGHYITTIPDSFNINKNGEQYAKLINRKTNERIFVKDLGKGDLIKNNMSERLESLNFDEQYSNVKNITLDGGIPCVYYEDSNNTFNIISYTNKYNHTLLVKCTSFRDNKTMLEDAKYVIDSATPNYKQNDD